MKELNVNEKCNGCGFCIASAPKYFKELSDGNAKVIKNFVDVIDSDQIENIIQNCPEGAISIINRHNFLDNQHEFRKYIVDKIQKYNDDFKIERVTAEDYTFWEKDRYIYFQTNDEWPPAYNSESAAKSAARSQFRDQCYSEQAYRPKLKEIFVNYKVNKLKPYYTAASNPDSAYFDIVCQVKEFLDGIASELDANGIECKSGWTSYEYPVDDSTYYQLEHFDDRSTSSGIIGQLKNRGRYTSIDWYIDHNVKISSMIVDTKRSIFGEHDIYKYYYTGLYDAALEFGKDLSNAIAGQAREITNEAVKYMNEQLEKLEKDIHEQLKKKIDELDELLEWAIKNPERLKKRINTTQSKKLQINTAQEKYVLEKDKNMSAVEKDCECTVQEWLDRVIIPEGHEKLTVKDAIKRREYGVPAWKDKVCERLGQKENGTLWNDFDVNPLISSDNQKLNEVVKNREMYERFLQDHFYRKYKGYAIHTWYRQPEDEAEIMFYNRVAYESGHPEYMIATSASNGYTFEMPPKIEVRSRKNDAVYIKMR